MAERLFFDFEHLFDADEYLYFMAETLAEEKTGAQCDFVASRLGLRAGSRVLDLGCGHGRHANELARRGMVVTGIDLVQGFLDVAKAEAAREGLATEFVRADMTTFAPPPSYDAAICLFDAFGFFDDEGQESALRNALGALVPGGRLLLDVRTREWMMRVPPCSVLDKGNGDMMIDRHHFDLESGRFVDRRTYVREGKQREVMFSVRLYAYTELRSLLVRLGFEVESVFGGFDGAPLSLARSRTLVIAKKPA